MPGILVCLRQVAAWRAWRWSRICCARPCPTLSGTLADPAELEALADYCLVIERTAMEALFAHCARPPTPEN